MAVTPTAVGSRHSSQRELLPVPWYLAGPLNTRGLEGDGGVEAAGDGVVDDGLLLLVEQRDHLPLRADRPLQPPVRPVQKPHNRRLLVGRGLWRVNHFEVLWSE